MLSMVDSNVHTQVILSFIQVLTSKKNEINRKIKSKRYAYKTNFFAPQSEHTDYNNCLVLMHIVINESRV